MTSTHEESIEVAAPPERIWKLFSDVAGWKNWNPGIERIEIHGPFEVGTRFTMQPPGSDDFVSTGVSVIIVDLPPGSGPHLHQRPYNEVFIVHDGKARFTI
jgi:uncharacterized protein YndB with AHSA1/START domain